MLLILLSCLLIVGTSAQSLNFGHCPDVKVVESLDVNKYSGLWYEYERSFPNAFEFAGACVTANYSVNDNGTVNVVNSQISGITGMPSSIQGIANIDDVACGNSKGCGKLIVKFPVPLIGETTGTYWVLDTDYTSYAAIWSCTDYQLFHASFAWILTRDQHPSKDVINKAKQIFTNNGIEWIIMTETDQDSC